MDLPGMDDITVGDGDEIKGDLGYVVSIKYTGTYQSGSGSAKPLPGLPKPDQVVQIPLGVNVVVIGFELGLLGMKVHGKRRITIPPDLAYGSAGLAGFGDSVLLPEESTLIFEVELVQLDKVPIETDETLDKTIDFTKTPRSR
jgi:FKBP-type peptidyl-prolyl cis-trans isomerase